MAKLSITRCLLRYAPCFHGCFPHKKNFRKKFQKKFHEKKFQKKFPPKKIKKIKKNQKTFIPKLLRLRKFGWSRPAGLGLAKLLYNLINIIFRNINTKI
jgi:hypothetical protein